jgi:aspartate kinase
MRCVVQKYGGSSVADLDKLRRVAERIAATWREGRPVVAVVSAMGNTTNELLALARQVAERPDRRELDMLVSVGERISVALVAIALRDLGVPAVSLTGSQSGIITDERHADARVVEVRPERLRQVLDEGKVAVVAGFQGVSREREVTTLGRGGSDTTAVVLAAALGAEWCEICSDVDGVWSSDPRVVPEAVKLDAMALDEALALARGGAKVLFEDAVRYARDHGVEIVASATFGPGSGTRLRAEAAGAGRIVGVTGDDQLVAIRLDEGADEVVRAVARDGGRLRLRSGDRIYVDVRNAHGGLKLPDGTDVRPTALVTAAGSGAGERVDLGLRAEALLGEAGIGVRAAGGSGDSLWWEVDRGAVDAAVRIVHQLRDA